MTVLDLFIYSSIFGIFLEFTEYLFLATEAYRDKPEYTREPNVPWIMHKCFEVYYKILCIYKITIYTTIMAYEDCADLLLRIYYWIITFRRSDVKRLIIKFLNYIARTIVREIEETYDDAIFAFKKIRNFFLRLYNAIIFIIFYFVEQILYYIILTYGIARLMYKGLKALRIWLIVKYRFWSFEINYILKRTYKNFKNKK